jgi:hypothetical protein
MPDPRGLPRPLPLLAPGSANKAAIKGSSSMVAKTTRDLWRGLEPALALFMKYHRTSHDEIKIARMYKLICKYM